MKKAMDEVMATGNAARGEAVYRSKASGCVQCHMIGGVGGPLAPDLRAIGASSPLDYIIDSILDPSKAVKDGYAATSVSTKDGDLIQGIKVREDTKELVLRDNLRDEIAVPISEIKKRKEAGSLMPVGLQDGLTRQEFVDLVRFLSELGKPGAYAEPAVGIVRRWRAIDPMTEEMALQSLPPKASDTGWQPAYATVGGDLPVSELPAAKESGAAYVYFQVAVSKPGEVRLKLNSTAGLHAFMDDRSVSLTSTDQVLTVPAGLRTMVFKVDTKARGGVPLHVEIIESTNSPARAIPVVGR